jgi:hypothetical protein
MTSPDPQSPTPVVPDGPLVMPRDEFGTVQGAAAAPGWTATKPCGCGPLQPCPAHLGADGSDIAVAAPASDGTGQPPPACPEQSGPRTGAVDALLLGAALDPEMRQVVAEAVARAVSAERERIRQIAIRTHAVCTADEGTSCYFAALIETGSTDEKGGAPVDWSFTDPAL